MPKHLHNTRYLIVLARSREKWKSKEQLDGDAAQGPHVDRSCIGNAEQDFWRAVESRLNVGVDRLPLVAC